jgi:undecaprenyl diphosphate synthase
MEIPTSNLKLQTSKQVSNPKKQIPKHIAIIMDGNGRWAQKRHLPRVEGHRRGAKSLKETVKSCMEIGVKYLTVYAFSTENWKRPKEEVKFLMMLLSSTIDREIDELHKNNIRVRFLGKISMLPAQLREKIRSAENKTRKNDALNLNIMLSYGGRTEIVDAIKSIVLKHIKSDKINEELVSDNLYTAGIPDPDIMIRTAGEMRISNFLLWQLSYSELWVTDVLWPDFRKKHLVKAIRDYQKRVRKYGGLK